MKKRLNRRLRKIAIVAAAFIGIVLIIWLISLLGGFINWLLVNWIPVLTGFAIATVAYTLVDVIFGNEKDNSEK